jgi:hypothetical protein
MEPRVRGVLAVGVGAVRNGADGLFDNSMLRLMGRIGMRPMALRQTLRSVELSVSQLSSEFRARAICWLEFGFLASGKTRRLTVVFSRTRDEILTWLQARFPLFVSLELSQTKLPMSAGEKSTDSTG